MPRCWGWRRFDAPALLPGVGLNKIERFSHSLGHKTRWQPAIVNHDLLEACLHPRLLEQDGCFKHTRLLLRLPVGFLPFFLPRRPTGLTQTGNDKQQLEPMLETLSALPACVGQVEQLLADSGYCSQANLAACEAAGVEAFIAVAREQHHIGWRERFHEPAPVAADAPPLAKMAHKLKTRAGRACYALRKQTVEPVFGIIKSVMGFRQFLLRGLDKVKGEWALVCLAWNLKRMAALRPKSVLRA